MADAVREASDEIARLALFGHSPNCKSEPHASTRPDELDTDCNLCAAIHRYEQRKREADGDSS